MSHFTVLVVGDDYEQALAPFHEFECTGLNDEYVQDMDITDKVRARMTGDKSEPLEEALSYFGLDERVVDDESKVDRDGDHQFGYAVVQDDQLVKAVDRTNPNAKWDWYQVGGRWSDFLKLKAGAAGERGEKSLLDEDKSRKAGYADQAQVGDVDFDGMIAEAGQAAGELHDKVMAALGEHRPTPWSKFVARVKSQEITIEQAREAYNAQPGVKEAHAAIGSFMSDAEILEAVMAKTRDAYAEYEGMDNSRTYALLTHDGRWLEPGEMGWFGISSETPETKEAFTRQYWDYVRGLAPETTVTVVDCHI
jgi:hypothetical protein